MIVIGSFGNFVLAGSSWQKDFNLSERTLVPTGRNDFFVLETGFQLVLESSKEKLIIIVMDETRVIDGITTRVVEEREWKNGQLREVSINFFAIDQETKDVFYFGEEVDMYRNNQVVSHKGAWLAGKNKARAGLIMPANPQVDMKYYQEVAPRVAMDRAEVLSLDETLETPAGTFTNCLKTKEGTALNFFEREYKTYAPGIGLIQDQKLLLVEYGFVDAAKQDRALGK
jgi:hypothetical protein